MTPDNGNTLLVVGEPAVVRDAWAEASGAEATDVATVAARLAADAGARALAFYRAPWEAFLGACDVDEGGAAAGRAALARWADDAPALLALAARWPDRVRLVNAGRLAGREAGLAAALADAGWPPVAPVATPPLAGPVDPALLARLFEDHAPERWDDYESLESVADLGGREPEFRSGDAAVADPLGDALAVWSDAVAARRAAATGFRVRDLDAARAQAAELAARLADAEARLAESEARVEEATDALRRAAIEHEERADRVQELSSENELLGEHVAQLRQELAEQARGAAILRDTVARLTRAADRARLQLSK